MFLIFQCNNRLSSELEFDPAPSRSITRKRPNKEIPEKNKHNDDGNARTSKRKRNEVNMTDDLPYAKLKLLKLSFDLIISILSQE